MRERQVWVGVTAVLGTSLLWLGAVSGLLLLRDYAARVPGAVAVLRACAHALLTVGLDSAPVAWLALAVAGVLLALLVPAAARAKRSMRHG